MLQWEQKIFSFSVIIKHGRNLNEKESQEFQFGGEGKDTSRPDGTSRKLLDVSKLKKLGWKSDYPLRKGIKKQAESIKDKVYESLVSLKCKF